MGPTVPTSPHDRSSASTVIAAGFVTTVGCAWQRAQNQSQYSTTVQLQQLKLHHLLFTTSKNIMNAHEVQ